MNGTGKMKTFFYWSLALVFITLPFPKYSINSISLIICVLLWLFFNSFKEKSKNLKKNFLLFLILSSIFWISLIGLSYTENFGEGLKNLQEKLPFVIFPLVLLSINLENISLNTLLKYFSYSVIVAGLFALTKALYFKINNLGDFFYYDQFSKLLEKHTTYFALYTIIAVIYFANKFLEKKHIIGIKNLIPIAFLLSILYLLSVRISIVSLIFVFPFLLFGNKRNVSKKNSIITSIIIVVSLLVYLTPNFQKRFNAKTPEGIEISDFDSRRVHWESVLNVISKNNLFFGAGTGDGRLQLYDEYRKQGFETGYINKYNAHNQFLETILFFGFLGLFALLLMLSIAFKKSLRANNFLGLAVIVAFLIFMTTESILERHSGIVLFSYLISLLSMPNIIRNNSIDEK